MDELTADVYSKPLEPNVKGVSYYQMIPHKNVGPAVNLK